METNPAILDDIQHVLDILKSSDKSATWKMGAASMLETIAANIRADVAAKGKEAK